MYDKRSYINLNMDYFEYLMENWYYYQEQYKLFCKSDKCGKRAFANEYDDKCHSANCAYDAIDSVCGLLNLDNDTVISVFKSIRRNSKYQHGWERQAHFSLDRFYYFEDVKTGSVESFIRACKKN